MFQPRMRARIIGVLLIAVGIVFLFLSSLLFLKIGFACILLGVFVMVMVTDWVVPQQLGEAQEAGAVEAVKALIHGLNLEGNAVFLPRSGLLAEERVFIPTQADILSVPYLDSDIVIAKGSDGNHVGVSIPPSGLTLLKSVDSEDVFSELGWNTINENLQRLVGVNMAKSVQISKRENGWDLLLTEPLLCPRDIVLCRQYPCPVCSAALACVVRAGGKKVWIRDAVLAKDHVVFHVQVG